MLTGLSERETKVLEVLASQAFISLKDLGKSLGVSAVTIRNDINSLNSKGFLIKTRGGVAPTFNSSIMQRQHDQEEEKNRIAKVAATLINNGDTVMIEAGSTTSLVGKYLLGKTNVRIVTNSLLLAPYARISPGIQLCMVGGDFRPESETLVGPTALSQLEKYHVRLAFVGTDGFSIENGLTSHSEEAAEIVRKMSHQSEITILLADFSKYGRKGFTRTLPIREINKLIIDARIDATIRQSLEELGIEVIVA